MLSRFFCCLRMILQKFDSFYTFWTGGIHDFQNQKMNASHDGSSHRQICSRLRYSQIIVYWSPGISVISVYSGVMDPAPGHQPPGSQQVRLHHQPQGQGDHHDELVMTWQVSPRSRMRQTLTSGGWCCSRWRSQTRAGTAARSVVSTEATVWGVERSQTNKHRVICNNRNVADQEWQ